MSKQKRSKTAPAPAEIPAETGPEITAPAQVAAQQVLEAGIVQERRIATTTAPNGTGAKYRDPRGRFLPGNKCSTGDPFVARREAWRRILYRTMSPAAVRRVLRKLVACAEAGESWAIKEVTDRILGKPESSDKLTVEHKVNLDNLLRQFDAARAAGLLPGPDDVDIVDAEAVSPAPPCHSGTPPREDDVDKPGPCGATSYDAPPSTT